jgi:alpha-D-xyloside xylohydrolase
LLKLGVGAIKVDFGEDAPLGGVYASGRTGWYEHNLYPLRYNKAVAEITKQVTGDSIIWARSAWAGSQRYPLHWGGDAENTDSAMAATLRAGMSFGLSGFSFWSHDVGGFVGRPDAALYRRWLSFGVLTSHTRCHGAPPREPWEYGEEFENDFRRAVELKYTLMPYIYTQAKLCSQLGHPMLRPLFFEFPADPASWLIDDEYLFGSDLLVAPLFAKGSQRSVYLPPGDWFDYQTGLKYSGAAWHEMPAGPLSIVLMVRSGRAIPRVAVAESTDQLDWKNIELHVFSSPDEPATAEVALADDAEVHSLELVPTSDSFELKNDPYKDRVTWRITH